MYQNWLGNRYTFLELFLNSLGNKERKSYLGSLCVSAGYIMLTVSKHIAMLILCSGFVKQDGDYYKLGAKERE